jgi:hypothetical protein
MLAALTSACDGALEGPPNVIPPDADVDAGPEAPCGETGEVILYFESACASCHQGSRFPDLRRDALPRLLELESQTLPGQRLVVPGDPEASFLYRKMAHTQGEEGGASMPLGRASPVPELALVERWIRAGAPTRCEDLVPTEVPYDPNTLDPAALFTCADPSAPRSSPSRVRRITDDEFTQVAVNATGTSRNPLQPPGGLAYPTYAEGVGMDPATLRLLMLHLPAASHKWTVGDPRSGRMYGLHKCCTEPRSQVVACMEDQAMPTDACLDRYVDTLLRRGALFRAPTEDEAARLRAYILERIADEGASGVTRNDTLSEIAQASLLMTGALFRSDVGDPMTMDGTVRELSNTELAFALGSVLTPAPVGAPIPQGYGSADDPDHGLYDNGRLARIAAAAADGSIRDPATRVALFRHYASGISEVRPDLYTGYRDTRGDFWIAPRLTAFFREWLGYGMANSAFKDNPAATSAFPSTGGQYDRAVVGYNTLQTPPQHSGSHETNLVQQLDDLIARVVVETDRSGQDVFRELLTTRRAFLPSQGEGGATTWAYGWTESIALDDASRWITYPEGSVRRGVLSHPAWLAAHGGNFEDDASLVLRGHWLRTQLFCQSFGDLSDVQGLQAMLGPSDPMHSARVRVARATQPGVDPDADLATVTQCWGCHQYMNTLGNAFELYNHAGFERATDHGGAPDGSTVIDNLPDPALNRAYASPVELLEAIAGSAYARRGMVRHAFRYFMGRDEVLADGCTLVEMEDALVRTGSFLSMLEALIASDTFVRRELATAGEP